MRSDLLVINKIDLAPYVGASLEVMERDTRKMRGDRPFLFTNLRAGVGVPELKALGGREDEPAGGSAPQGGNRRRPSRPARSPLALPHSLGIE